MEIEKVEFVFQDTHSWGREPLTSLKQFKKIQCCNENGPIKTLAIEWSCRDRILDAVPENISPEDSVRLIAQHYQKENTITVVLWSGIYIDNLERWIYENEDSVRNILQEMKNVPREKRTAMLSTAGYILGPDGKEICFSKSCPGTIFPTEKEREERDYITPFATIFSPKKIMMLGRDILIDNIMRMTMAMFTEDEEIGSCGFLEVVNTVCEKLPEFGVYTR